MTAIILKLIDRLSDDQQIKLSDLLEDHFVAVCVITMAILTAIVLALNLFALYVGISILQSLGVL